MFRIGKGADNMNIESEILQVNLDDIIPNRFQPRIAFDEQGLKELSDSIKEHGIIQPLVLRKLGNKYEIIAGERRYKAATMAGLTTVPAVISNMDDNKSAEVAIVENIQRRDLTAIEEAKSYKNLLDKGYLTQEQLAKKMGVSQPSIANKLRLLNLDDEVQQALLAEKISERHARALLQIDNKEEQKNWLNRIINERLTVRLLDQEIKKAKNVNDGSDIPNVNIDTNVDSIKENARDIGSEEPVKQETISQPEETVSSEQSKENDGKFFSFSDLPLEDIEMPVMKKEEPKQELEIIDVPSPLESPVIEEISKEEPKAEPIKPAPEKLDISFSPNNKFFTPDMDDSRPKNDIFIPQQEVVIDPMSMVEKLDPSFEEKQSEAKKLEIIDGVKEIRGTVEELNKKGFNVKVEEIDFGNSYQIILQVEKND